MVPSLLVFWWAVRLVHGAPVATIALIVFALGPMVAELAKFDKTPIPADRAPRFGCSD
jgi:hypothetical protein